MKIKKLLERIEKTEIIRRGEHYSHMAYLSLVAIEGSGLYAKAAVIALLFVAVHWHLVEKRKSKKTED